MKVAGAKGIRLIMGAANGERGSVFCNTKHLKSALTSMKSRPRQVSLVRVGLLWCLQYCPVPLFLEKTTCWVGKA